LTIRATLSALVALWLMAGTVGIARAQSYPDRPIKLVLPFPAGGATDTSARLVVQHMQARLGQTIIIENQGGHRSGDSEMGGGRPHHRREGRGVKL